MSLDDDEHFGLGATARTGEKCPKSGTWQAMNSPQISTYIEKGQTMPSNHGRDECWYLSADQFIRFPARKSAG